MRGGTILIVALGVLPTAWGCTGAERGEQSATSGAIGSASDDGSDSEGESSGFDDGAFDYDVNMPPDGTGCACAAGLDLIYVVGSNGELWSFDPATTQFDRIGALGCDRFTPTNPFSMAVSRSGVAWVAYWNGDVYTVPVIAPEDCSDPGFSPKSGRWSHFGMAFASDSIIDACDDLYVHSLDVNNDLESPNVGELGKLDQVLVDILPIDALDFSRGELTGTGDGRLFAFTGLSPAKLVEYDKTTAQVLGVTLLDSIDLSGAFAFAFWGGDFYFFTESGEFGSNSKVTRLDFDESDGGGLTIVAPEAPVRVFGAGVSTCAPLVPEG